VNDHTFIRVGSCLVFLHCAPNNQFSRSTQLASYDLPVSILRVRPFGVVCPANKQQSLSEHKRACKRHCCSEVEILGQFFEILTAMVFPDLIDTITILKPITGQSKAVSCRRSRSITLLIPNICSSSNTLRISSFIPTSAETKVFFATNFSSFYTKMNSSISELPTRTNLPWITITEIRHTRTPWISSKTSNSPLSS